MLEAKDLPQCELSKYLEHRISTGLQKEREARAAKVGARNGRITELDRGAGGPGSKGACANQGASVDWLCKHSVSKCGVTDCELSKNSEHRTLAGMQKERETRAAEVHTLSWVQLVQVPDLSRWPTDCESLLSWGRGNDHSVAGKRVVVTVPDSCVLAPSYEFSMALVLLSTDSTPTRFNPKPHHHHHHIIIKLKQISGFQKAEGMFCCVNVQHTCSSNHMLLRPLPLGKIIGAPASLLHGGQMVRVLLRGQRKQFRANKPPSSVDSLYWPMCSDLFVQILCPASMCVSLATLEGREQREVFTPRNSIVCVVDSVHKETGMIIKEGKEPHEVITAENLTVRVVNSIIKKAETKPKFYETFSPEGFPSEFPYRQRVVLLFQKLDGVDKLDGMGVTSPACECVHERASSALWATQASCFSRRWAACKPWASHVSNVDSHLLEELAGMMASICLRHTNLQRGLPNMSNAHAAASKAGHVMHVAFVISIFPKSWAAWTRASRA
eukprot:scaffold26082_cov18-Tisochrysis_lutea.AAC.4